MNQYALMLLIGGAFLFVIILLNWALTRKKQKKQVEDTRSTREKHLDKISEMKKTK